MEMSFQDCEFIRTLIKTQSIGLAKMLDTISSDPGGKIAVAAQFVGGIDISDEQAEVVIDSVKQMTAKGLEIVEKIERFYGLESGQ